MIMTNLSINISGSGVEVGSALVKGQAVPFLILGAIILLFLCWNYGVIFANLSRRSGRAKYVIPLLFFILLLIIWFFLFQYSAGSWWNVLTIE